MLREKEGEKLTRHLFPATLCGQPKTDVGTLLTKKRKKTNSRMSKNKE